MVTNLRLWTSTTTPTISAFSLLYSILQPHGYSVVYKIHNHNLDGIILEAPSIRTKKIPELVKGHRN